MPNALTLTDMSCSSLIAVPYSKADTPPPTDSTTFEPSWRAALGHLRPAPPLHWRLHGGPPPRRLQGRNSIEKLKSQLSYQLIFTFSVVKYRDALKGGSWFA